MPPSKSLKSQLSGNTCVLLEEIVIKCSTLSDRVTCVTGRCTMLICPQLWLVPNKGDSSHIYTCSATFKQSGLSLLGRAATGGPCVWMWWVISCLMWLSRNTGRVRMSAYRLAVGWKTTGLINGVRMAIPRTVRSVELSTNRPRFTSTKRPK